MGWRELAKGFKLTITGEPSGGDTNYAGAGERVFYELPSVSGNLPVYGEVFKDYSTSAYCASVKEYPGIVCKSITITKDFFHPDSFPNSNATSIDGRKAVVNYESDDSGGLTPQNADALTKIIWSGESQVILMPAGEYDGWYWYYGDDQLAMPVDATIQQPLEQDIPHVVPRGTITVEKRYKEGDFPAFKSAYTAAAGKVNNSTLFDFPSGQVLLSTFSADPRNDEFGRARVFVSIVYEYIVLRPYGWNGTFAPNSSRIEGTGKPMLCTVSPGVGPGSPRRWMYDYADIDIFS